MRRAALVALLLAVGCGGSSPPPSSPGDICARDPGEGLPPRLGGKKYVRASRAVMSALFTARRHVLFVRLDVCASPEGNVTLAALDVSSGYPEYDEDAITAVKAWKLCPFADPAPRCEKVTMRWVAK